MNDSDLLGLIEALRADPADEVSRLVLADLLDDLKPEPVQLQAIPGWLRLCWLREAPKAFRSTSRRLRSTSTFAVLEDIRAFLAFKFNRDDLRRYVRISYDDGDLPPVDVCGTTTVAGLECFVHEFAGDRAAARRALAPMTWAVPSAVVAFSQTALYPGRVRAVLLPPLVLPPAKAEETRQRRVARTLASVGPGGEPIAYSLASHLIGDLRLDETTTLTALVGWDRQTNMPTLGEPTLTRIVSRARYDLEARPR